MMRKRILALDVGSVRIGVAISDALGLTAQPLLVIDRKKTKDVISKLLQLIKDNDVSEILIGLPRHMNGSLGPKAREVQSFGAELHQQIPAHVSITYWDERLTTVASEALLKEAGIRREKRRQLRDKIAASLILQSYLQRQKKAGQAGG